MPQFQFPANLSGATATGSSADSAGTMTTKIFPCQSSRMPSSRSSSCLMRSQETVASAGWSVIMSGPVASCSERGEMEGRRALTRNCPETLPITAVPGGICACALITAVNAAARMVSTVTKKFRYLRGQEFLALPRRERRAYPSWVCKERATKAAAKRPATRRAATELASGGVAPQSQSAEGYAPSSRLARGQFWRSAGIDIYLSQY